MLPIRFEYVRDDFGSKVYLSILGEVRHHYTGVAFYHVREEGEEGWIKEGFKNGLYIENCLKRRVEEKK